MKNGIKKVPYWHVRTPYILVSRGGRIKEILEIREPPSLPPPNFIRFVKPCQALLPAVWGYFTLEIGYIFLIDRRPEMLYNARDELARSPPGESVDLRNVQQLVRPRKENGRRHSRWQPSPHVRAR
jgi:hypothetical protein